MKFFNHAYSAVTPALSKPVSHGNPHIEWVPYMLRRSRAIPLAFACWLFLIGLEAFNQVVKKKRGLRTDNENDIRAARYLPTVGVILLSFAWKSVVHDVKKVMPFATMSRKFTPARNSILLDYVNNIEAESAMSSLRRGHWPVFLGLIAGLCFGILVSLSNALTYTDLLASNSHDIPLTVSTVFNPTNKLVSDNGSLLMPWNYLGNQPFAAVSSLKLANGHPPPWTSDGYAFESFSTAENYTNASITANVQAFSASLICTELRSTALTDLGVVLLGDKTDIANAGCSEPIEQQSFKSKSSSEWNTAFAWLNVTACSTDPDDQLILATIVRPKDFNDLDQATAYDYKSLVCRPKFTTQPARVSVNATTGEVVGYTLDTASVKEIDLGVTNAGLWMYLNNPTDSLTQVFASQGATSSAGPYSTNNRPVATVGNVSSIVSSFTQQEGITPFFSLLGDGYIDSLVDSYLKDTETFKNDVSKLAGNVLVQTVNAFARDNSSTPIQGTVTMNQPRLFIREASLRALQVILGIIGVLAILLASVLRPRTLLTEDPSTLAHTAVLLAASDPRNDAFLGVESTETLGATFKRYKHIECMLQVDEHSNTPKLHLRHKNGTPLSEEELSLPHKSLHVPDTHHAGWQPIPLLIWSKVFIVLAFCAVMAVLIGLQWKSSSSHGLLTNTGWNASGLTLGITIVLVLLGYVASGIDGSVRELTSFRSLYTSSPHKPLLHHPKDIPILGVIFQSTARQTGFAMIASSLVILLFPIIKIIAAGLYIPTVTTSILPITVDVDTSLMSQFKNTFNSTDSSIISQRASQFVEWTQIPELYVPQRAGILDNLVFSNVTSESFGLNNASTSSSDIRLRVPAISVNVTCTAAGPSDFNLIATYSNYTKNVTLNFECANDMCRQAINMSGTSIDSIAPYSYVGLASLKGYSYSNQPKFIDTPYVVSIADFSAMVNQWVKNVTKIDDKDGTIVTGPGILNVQLPTYRAVSCIKNLTEVEVDTLFTRSTVSGLNGSTTTLPWSPASFDPASIKLIRRINDSLPVWLAPKFRSVSQYSGGTEQNGILSSQNLWPTRSSSSNIFELIAGWADFTYGNISTLLDADGLARATEAVYTNYITQVLTELRPGAHNWSTTAGAQAQTEPNSQSIQGTLTAIEYRIEQHLPSTIAVEALLAVSLVCMLWVFVRYPSKPFVPKPPDSLAARLSFLANSELVGRLRQEQVKKIGETNIWGEMASLGWWKSRSDAVGYFKEWRWGIDLGKPVEKKWDKRPGGSSIASTRAGRTESGFELSPMPSSLSLRTPTQPMSNQEFETLMPSYPYKRDL